MPADRILLTGGSGRLGQELRRLLPGAAAPPRAELDVTDPAQVGAVLDRYAPQVLVHAAAYTDVAGAERDRAACWRVNVAGTRNVAAAAAQRGVFVVHVSTDYVFEGTRGGYAEDDIPGPVRNHYALTKLVAEELARLAPAHLVVRTSFRGRAWPHPAAFTDLYTSQDYVDVIAPDLALAIQHCRTLPFHTLHIATERKSAFDLARRRRPDVRPGSRREAGVALPQDSSLDTARWRATRQRLLAPRGGHPA